MLCFINLVSQWISREKSCLDLRSHWVSRKYDICSCIYDTSESHIQIHGIGSQSVSSDPPTYLPMSPPKNRLQRRGRGASQLGHSGGLLGGAAFHRRATAVRRVLSGRHGLLATHGRACSGGAQPFTSPAVASTGRHSQASSGDRFQPFRSVQGTLQTGNCGVGMQLRGCVVGRDPPTSRPTRACFSPQREPLTLDIPSTNRI